MNHLLRSGDLSKQELLKFFAKADKFLPVVSEKKKLKIAEGNILATLFYEPSTRTRFSFETAMIRLGGAVISNADMNATSSVKKGETLFDTAKMLSTYANIIAVRHPSAGSVADFAKGSSVPVINAGDGPGDHPTQGLLDMYTIWKHFGKIDGLTIGMVGDLKNSRVLHAECEMLSKFKGVKFVFVSPKGLEMPAEIVKKLMKFKIEVTGDLNKVVGDFDVLSQTRIQKERFGSDEEYRKYKGIYIVTKDLMKRAKKNMILIHPLPRVDEIEIAVDSDPRAKYFEQAGNGVAVRMAIIAKLLNL
ncbi:aspartate carbamoyltransferase [Candidatus Peregrinibacteria bacterium]|nr:aspartate carbamoyltransferase [Candidatus Peregrinibacteria bacterium]